MECLINDAKKKKKKGYFLYFGSRVDEIITGAKSLATRLKCYGFNDDLIETIN